MSAMTIRFDLVIALIALAGAIGCLLLYVLHKVRRVHLMTYRLSDEIKAQSDTVYRQLEALHALYAELDVKRALPPTRGWSASPDFLLLIARHARDARPRSVVECGSGTSTVVLARCMQINGSGHVYSLEHQLEFVDATGAELERHDLSDWATVIHAPLRPHDLNGETWSWYSHETLPELKIDMLVIDGPPMPVGPLVRYPVGPILFPKLAPGAAVFLDDAARDDEKRIIERWQREFPDLDRQDHGCEKGCVELRSAGSSIARPGSNE